MSFFESGKDTTRGEKRLSLNKTSKTKDERRAFREGLEL